MESQRSFLFIALMVVTFLLYQQWQLENAPVQQPVATNQIDPTVPNSNSNTNNDDFVPASSSATTPIIKPTASSAALVEVTTDVLNIKINKEFDKVRELGHQFQIYLMNLERFIFTRLSLVGEAH